MKNKPSLYFSIFVLFLLSGFFAAYISSQRAVPESVAERIAFNFLRESAVVDQAFARIERQQDVYTIVTQFPYPLFLFQNGELLYWSSNQFIPTWQQVQDDFRSKLFTTGSEAYVFKKKMLQDSVLLICTIPLVKKYPIRNDYLKAEYNDKILPVGDVSIVEASNTEGIPVCVDDKCFFRISFLSGEVPLDDDLTTLAVVFLIIAIIALLLLVYHISIRTATNYPEISFLILLFSFWIIRLVMTWSGFPGNLIRSTLFDPQVFAASSLNASLGDLFINMLAVLTLSFFVFRNYSRFWFVRRNFQGGWQWAIGIFSSLCILFAALFPVVVVQTLYNNSAIDIGLSQSLRFDAVRMIAIFSVLISGICSFLFSHAFIRILTRAKDVVLILVQFGIACVVFSVINELSAQQYIWSLVIGSFYFSSVYGLRLSRSLRQLTFATFAYLFVAIFFLAINAAIAVQHFTHREKMETQFRFASNFLVDRDDLAEFLLNEASTKIGSDAFIQGRLANPFLGKDAIRQKIRQVFLPSYFNKYDVDIFIFNSAGDPIDQGTSTFSDFVRRYDADAYQTRYEGIRFINNPASDIARTYLIIIPVRKALPLGYVIIQLSLKKIIPENVYPELLVDYRFQQFYRTQDLSYAVYSGKRLLFTSGEFNYEKYFDTDLLGRPPLYKSGLSFSGYDHIALEDASFRVAIVSTGETPFVNKLADFSFLFVMGLFMILIMIFIQGVVQYFRGGRLFFSARIQLYLNLAFFVPLIIVSVSTLSLTSQSSQRQLDEEYLNKSKVFGEQIVNYLADEGGDENFTPVSLSNRLGDLAKLSNLDATIFDSQGRLLATSQTLIYESNMLSPYLNANAYARFRNGEVLFIERERVGGLQYFVAYFVLKSSGTGNTFGILGIPFFQSAYLLERIQSVVLINILNIFAFIFIVLLLLSYVVAERLTFPLRFITQSLRKTSLTGGNTPLTWHAEDEIGMMVKEYNSMLYKLAESKSELEQTQREKAWREIAQQVAHEIKNPLTPMKLTLQQLQRAVEQGTNSDEKTRRAIETVLGQVETLNEIASSFSGFAKMPEPVIQPIDIMAIIRHAVDLHSPTGRIQLSSFSKEVIVLGDAQLLSRTFSNLILNALQSGRPGQAVEVNIVVEVLRDKCRVSFQDNGSGIDPAIADRVFLPHFSTKKSGSGLGLAIASQGISQMKGRLWFETQVGKGTTFFVELPLR